MPDDHLRESELVSRRGAWGGLLFDNPRIGLPPRLTFTFTFEFEEVTRDYGSSPVSVTIDWVELAVRSILDMAGISASCDEFAGPIESSVYFFEHHRYDSVRLQVVEQHEGEIVVTASIVGDVDDLGLARLELSGSLRFEGIIVQLSDDPATVSAAAERLREWTDIGDLQGRAAQRSYVFELMSE